MMGQSFPMLLVCFCLLHRPLYVEGGCGIVPDANGHVDMTYDWCVENKVARLWWCAFNGCSQLKSMTIAPDYMTTWDNGVFQSTSLKQMTIPDTLSSMGAWTFTSRVTNITLTGGRGTNRGGLAPASVTFSGLLQPISDFDPWWITTVVVANSSTRLRDREFATFQGNMPPKTMSYVENIIIEASDDSLSIGSKAFGENCEKLKSVVVKRSNVSMEADSFNFSCITSARFDFIKDIYAPGFTNVLTCADEKCGCRVPGMGSSFGEDSPYFNCAIYCPAGKYANGSAFDNGKCHQCPANTFSRMIGASSCYPCSSDATAGGPCGDQCPIGTRIVNGTDCAYCDAGKYSDEEGAYDCTSCPQGKYSTERGANSSSTCISCQAGWYANRISSIMCAPCVAGKSTLGSGASVCTSCKAGRYSSRDGAPFCTACPVAKYATEGQVECQPCYNGTTTIEGEGRAVTDCFKNCTIGHASEGSPTTCQLCGPGSFNDQIGQRTCSECPRGRFMLDKGATECTDCSPGRFSRVTASPICELCPGGTYSTEVAAKEVSSCIQCPLGQFSYPGASCRLTPAGTYVDKAGANDSTSCPAGRYQSHRGQTLCDESPSGFYSQKGMAISLPCPPGTFSTEVGATSMATCQVCPGNTYSSDGATDCISCDEDFIANEEHIACIIDPASLAQESLLKSLYRRGVGLSGAGIVAAGFLAVAGYLSYRREKFPDDAAQISRMHVLMKSTLSGLSFGSEFFLVIGIATEEPVLAGIILAFRLLHLFVGAIITIALFLPSICGTRFDSIIVGASSLRGHLHDEFCRRNTSPLGVLALLSCADATMVQFMPWKKSRFCAESNGFPSMGLLRCVLMTKALQGGVSTVCQLVFLFKSSSLGGSTVTAQAKILFFVNICSSVTGVVLGLLLLGIKSELLSTVRDTITDASYASSTTTLSSESLKSDVGSVEMSAGRSYMSENPMHDGGKRVSSICQRDTINAHKSKAETSRNLSDISEHPTHAGDLIPVSSLSSADEDTIKTLKEQVAEKDVEIMTLKCRIVELERPDLNKL